MRGICATSGFGINEAYTLGDIRACEALVSNLVKHPVVATPHLPRVTPAVMARKKQSRIFLARVTEHIDKMSNDQA